MAEWFNGNIPSGHQINFTDRLLTEKQWQAQVEQLARLIGWMCYHTWNSMRSSAGFPDIVMVKGNEIIFVELKTNKGKLTPQQVKWLDALCAAGQRVYVWRPNDLNEVRSVLTGVSNGNPRRNASHSSEV